MENAKGKEGSSTEKPAEECITLSFEPVPEPELPWPTNEPSTSSTVQKCASQVTQRKRIKKEKESSQSDDNLKPRKKIPIPPLPSKLPPVHLVHRDILRAWCHQLKLSTKGQKLDAYKRLCEYRFPSQNQNFPATAKEAKIQTRLKKSNVVKSNLDGLQKMNMCPEGTKPPEAAPSSAEGAPAFESVLQQDINAVDNTVIQVTSSTSEAVLASWSRIAGKAGKVEVEESPQETYAVRWCVVHGRSLPANRSGWVRLQFHAGQAWVPEEPGRVSALFLIPASSFPPPHMEDNLLCPKCVQRNRVLKESLQSE
ncbi:developmental pluripotency-associated protein 4 [Echinops telfairi]|uniref:Developmental pluripotency-associated protein 4 n=1 Tax=Echinops telfairi TaxID=9371 RepID=A0AC55CS08_ECHTE|nr:developmental pluripotency-associated protein 4 [Echinops telfairi]